MTTTATTITPAAHVANALSAIHRAAAQIPAAAIFVHSESVTVLASNVISAERWRERFPAGVPAGDVFLPLHVGIDGDVEGGL